MKPVDGHFPIYPESHVWKPAKPMQVPYTDLLEHTKSENLGARLWRLPPKSANTLHKHIKAEEFYFVLEGTGRIRIGDQTLTLPKFGGVLVGPDSMRQIFNDSEADTLWLIVGAPEQEFEPGEPFDLKRFWPVDPKQLPPELDGCVWPPPAGKAAD